jgi:hypothetical protein
MSEKAIPSPKPPSSLRGFATLAPLVLHITVGLDHLIVWWRNLRTTTSTCDASALLTGRNNLAPAASRTCTGEREHCTEDGLPEQQHASASFFEMEILSVIVAV